MATSNADGRASSPREIPPTGDVKKKIQRAQRACDFCHSRSIRCRPSESNPSSCQSCLEYDRKCTYDRPAKKRGVKPNTTRNVFAASRSSSIFPVSLEDLPARLPSGLSGAVIHELAGVYLRSVHPLYPLFQRHQLLDRLARSDYQHDLAFFAAIMAMCALTCARVRDGAVDGAGLSPEALDQLSNIGALALSAEAALPRSANTTVELDCLRSCALLALLAFQNGETSRLQFFLGIYHTLAESSGFTHESFWAPDIDGSLIEERRRVFWSVYMLEMLTSATFSTPLTTREAHAQVCLPQDDDDTIAAAFESTSTLSTSSAPASRPDWFKGWNFLVFLHRVLEHALERHRSSADGTYSSLRALFIEREHPVQDIVSTLGARYMALPAPFRNVALSSESAKKPLIDEYSILAININMTWQVVQIVLYSIDPSQQALCLQFCQKLLPQISQLPLELLRISSAPLLHEVATIVSFAAVPATAGKGMVEAEQIRAVLHMAISLLDGIWPASHAIGHPADGLRAALAQLESPSDSFDQASSPSTYA